MIQGKKVFRVDHYSSGLGCNEYESCTRVLGPAGVTEDQFREDTAKAKKEYVEAVQAYETAYNNTKPADIAKYLPTDQDIRWKPLSQSAFLEDNAHLPYREIDIMWKELRERAKIWLDQRVARNFPFIAYLLKYGYTRLDDLEDEVYVDLYWYKSESTPKDYMVVKIIDEFQL